MAKKKKAETPRFQVATEPQELMTPTIESNVWRTKEGDILMADMPDEHLEKAIYFAEHKFVKQHHECLRIADSVAVFFKKMNQLRDEAEKRGLQVPSLADKNDPKYAVLKNSRVLAIYED
jgi:hypothetical protein